MMPDGPKPWNPVRNVLRELRHAPDRLLHRRRHRKVKESLASRGTGSAVFICHGNINRSAYAAAAFTRALRPGSCAAMRVTSCGFVGPDRPASELAQQVARRNGIDLSVHRSRLIDIDELKETDIVVVMNTRQRADVCRLSGRRPQDIVLLGDLDPTPIRRRAVKDPYGHNEPVFEDVFRRIDRCVEQLAGVLAERQQ